MCPDQQIISLYLDDELPSPWKEKFEAHLASCGNCQNHLDQYRGIRNIMREDRAGVSAELESRVWNRIITDSLNRPVIAGNIPSLAAKTRSPSFWSRGVTLPVPAAATAAIIFVIIAFFAVQGIQSRNIRGYPENAIVAGIGADVQGIPMSDMNDVLQYLSREDSPDFLIIKLPETRSFSSTGEPALIKAADYTRRNVSR